MHKLSLSLLTIILATISVAASAAKNTKENENQAKHSALEVRITALEEEVRRLNGKLEEADFTIQSFAKKLDKIIADIDFRITSIEKETKQGGMVKFYKNNDSAINQSTTSPTVKTTEQLEKEYNNAFATLRENNYAQAETKFKQFIDTNGSNPFLGNAYYWLAETFYVRNKFEDAAVYFLKGYQEEENNNKKYDSLLKLGMSLARLEKKEEACTTFDKLKNESSQLSNTIKDKLESEKKQLKCQ